MRLFLCSNFSKSGKLIQDEVEGKNVLFIPTASIEEEYKGYVNSARQLWQEMNVNVILILSYQQPLLNKLKKPSKRQISFISPVEILLF